MTRPITEWKLFPSWPDPGRSIIATMVCPGCGKEWSIGTKNHTIAADGVVSPSWVCPGTGCGFHEFIHLVGWTPPTPPP